MKKKVLIPAAILVVLCAMFGVYKYYIEEVVDYYTLSYKETPLGEPDTYVRKNNYSSVFKTDEAALKYEEKEFKDYMKKLNSGENVTNSPYYGTDAYNDAISLLKSERRWLIRCKHTRANSPDEEMLKEVISNPEKLGGLSRKLDAAVYEVSPY
jgi:hypothetical protein